MKKLLMILLFLTVLLCSFAGCNMDREKKKEEEKVTASSYEDPVDVYMKVYSGALTKNDLKYFYPAEYWNFNVLDEEWENLQNTMEVLTANMSEEFGDDYKVTYKIVSREEMELEEIREVMKDAYNVPPEDIEKAYALEVEMTAKGSELEDTVTQNKVVMKIRGMWYPYQF